MSIDYSRPDDPGTGSGTDVTEEASAKKENSGTIILDAACAPQNISYPLSHTALPFLPVAQHCFMLGLGIQGLG